MRRRQRTESDRAVRDGRRAVLAAILLVLVVAMHWSTGGPLIHDFLLGKNRDTKADRPVSGDALTTASIFIAPHEGNICEHRRIDNATWVIRRDGYVTCDDVLSGSSSRSEMGAPTRIEAIRDGFFQRR
jgi:hypothetical protein